MKTMKHYYDLYLKCDVLLFRKFRNGTLKNYGLCPSYYLSAQAICWDAMPNMTTVELELISDANLYLFFEKGMDSRVFYICKRYIQANNKL